MRISELSASSGVSIPTIKFYLREGLLPPGTSIGPNRADYGEAHLHRLRLLRALTVVGKLSLGDARRVLAAAADAQVSLHELLGTAQYALEPQPPKRAGDDAELASAWSTVDATLASLGWQVAADAPARGTVAHAIASLRALGWEVTPEHLVRYGRAVDELAAAEVSIRDQGADREMLVERMVVGSVLYEVILSALRRLAHEHHSARRG